MSQFQIKKKQELVNQQFACVLDAYKICNECGECNYCDLVKNKICDNCGKCLDEGDFNGVIIDEIILPKT